MRHSTAAGPKGQHVIAFLAAGLVLAWPLGVFAQPANNHLDQIVDVYRDHAAAWSTVLRAYALKLFWLLATIEFCWSGIGLVLRGADLGEFLAELVNRIFFIGLFLTLLLNSDDWAGAVVTSFRTAANAASTTAGGTGEISPSNIFDVGLAISNRVMDEASFWNPGDSLGLVIASLVILVCFAIIAAALILALVESYLVISAGVLMMGFGGSRWTKDWALKTVTYAVSVGAKLFVLQLLVGLGEALVRGWLATFTSTNTNILLMVGSAIVMLALVWSIPSLVQGLVTGSSLAHGGTLIGAATSVGGAAAAVAGSVIGSGAVAQGALRLANEQLRTAEQSGGGPGTRIAQACFIASQTAKNVVGATASDIGRRLSGRAPHGAMPFRMAASMNDQAEVLRLDRQKPPTSAATAAPKPPSEPDNVIRPADKKDVTS